MGPIKKTAPVSIRWGESPRDTDVSRRDVDQHDAAYHDSLCDEAERCKRIGANVLSDQVVLLGSSSKGADRPDHPMRLVVVKIRPHVSGGKYKVRSSGVDRDGFLRIATNLLDVPAEILALLYAYRWTIEIFFRQFQYLLGCRHLLSHNRTALRSKLTVRSLPAS